MSVTGISTNQTAAMSLISGTTYEPTTSVNDVLAQGQSADETTISKGGQQMSELKKLQASDPDKFKESAQKISDQLAQKATETTDSHEAGVLNDMAAKFADAAKSGSMDGLKPHAPQSGAMAANSDGSKQNALLKFRSNQGNGGPMATLDSVISDVLSGVSDTSSSASLTATSETAA